MTDRMRRQRGTSSSEPLPRRHEYQVHVEGRLSRAVLSALGWSSRIEPERCHLRVRAETSELAELLRTWAVSGLVVERVTRISGTTETPSAPAASHRGHRA